MPDTFDTVCPRTPAGPAGLDSAIGLAAILVGLLACVDTTPQDNAGGNPSASGRSLELAAKGPDAPAASLGIVASPDLRRSKDQDVTDETAPGSENTTDEPHSKSSTSPEQKNGRPALSGPSASSGADGGGHGEARSSTAREAQNSGPGKQH